MAGGLGADLSGVKGYTVGLLFLAFVVISVVMEAALHQVSFHSYRHSPGLYHLYLKLKDEIMLLGILSLILELFMNGLNGLCVSGAFVLNSADDANSTDGSAGSSGSDGSDGSSGDPSANCPTGMAELWSVVVRHDTHLFLFWFAVFYLLNFFIVVSVGKLLIRQWKKWERHQETEDEASTRRSSLTEDERVKLSKNNQASPGVDPFIVHSIEWAHGKVQLPPPRSGSSLMITAGGAALWLVGVGALVVVDAALVGLRGDAEEGGSPLLQARIGAATQLGVIALIVGLAGIGVRRVARVLGPADERLYLGLRAVFVSRHRLPHSFVFWQVRGRRRPPSHTPPRLFSSLTSSLPPPSLCTTRWRRTPLRSSRRTSASSPPSFG